MPDGPRVVAEVPDVSDAGKVVAQLKSSEAVARHTISKEISWLAFNERVLQEAADSDVPLFERIKFLGIFSSNLDEFFRIRVATLKRFCQIGGRGKKLLEHEPRKILNEVQEIVRRQHQVFDQIYSQVQAELAEQGIHIVNETQLSAEQGRYVKHYFRSHVRPKLFPLMIDQVGPFPEIRDQIGYLAVSLAKRADSKKRKYALIEIPTGSLSRFVVLPPHERKQYIILLDDVIRYGLSEIFSVFGFQHQEAYTIKLTRDAELEFDNDLWQSYIKKVSKSLKHRKEGSPVRFIHDARMPRPLLRLFVRNLKLNGEDTVIAGARYHNFRDFMSFPDIGRSEQYFEHRPSLPHPSIDRRRRLLQTIREKDLLLHYPYQSFDYVIDFLRECSIDPKVTSIKLTIYRAARDSSVINAVINAAKNGKRVVVVLELQARFDEEANIDWGNKLQEEGVKVIYGVPGLKVHAKLCLVTRHERDVEAHYAIVATGNFNEDTARIYSDHALFTADKRITVEVKKVFDFYEHNYKTARFKHLLVSPFDFRRKMLKLIRNEIKNAGKGKPAYLFFKLNNLVDTEIVQHLYEASQAGVDIKLIVRSMFSLIPGQPELSENIQAISIVDRYLEHSRVLVACNDGKPLYFISSADLMPRNLDRRVEVTCPIYDRELQQELQTFLDIQWRDNVKARVWNVELENRIRQNSPDNRVRAQWAIREWLKGEEP